MKKILKIAATCLSAVLFYSSVGCANQNKTNEDLRNKEIIQLTKDNWEEYLTYQKRSETTPVTTRSLYGVILYESTGTFFVDFYSKADVKFQNVKITIRLWVSTIAYYGDKSSIALKDRIPDDWYFTCAPDPQVYESLTYWEIIKSGTLSNEGEISFSEPCKMLYAKPAVGSVRYQALEDAVWVSFKDISGQVIVDKN